MERKLVTKVYKLSFYRRMQILNNQRDLICDVGFSLYLFLVELN